MSIEDDELEQKLDWTAVESTNVAAVAWRFESWDDVDEDDAGVLFVRFRNGGVYQYDAVPRATYDQLLDTPSKGRFVAQRLKGRFATTRMK